MVDVKDKIQDLLIFESNDDFYLLQIFQIKKLARHLLKKRRLY